MSGDVQADEFRAVLAEVGRRIGVPARDLAAARLLRGHSNVVFLLPAAKLLIRISTNPDAQSRVAAAVMVTRWLAARGFPCTVPAEVADQPLLEHGRVVSVWRHLRTVPEPPPTGRELGELLRLLHAQPPPPYLPA